MIIGIGTDVQTISAMAQTASRTPRTIDAILTEKERQIFDQRKGKHQIEFLAGRYSIKEAFSKALGTGISRGVGFLDIEVLVGANGEPILTKAPLNEGVQAHLSISHTGDLVHSLVVLEQDMTSNSMNQPIAKHRPAWIEVSAEALKHNIAYIKALTQTQKVCAVVKANAYGHGLEVVAPVLQAQGVDAFAVATMDEGIWLREFGVTQPILILGVTPAHYIDTVADYDLTPVVPSLEWLESALNVLPHGDQLKLSVAVDSGMGRIGIRDHAELEAVVALIASRSDLTFESIWTHFATADTTNVAYFEQQLQNWHALVDDQAIPESTWRHLANSGTSLWHELPSHDMIRLGAGMYGFDPSQGDLPNRDLMPVMSLKAELVHVKEVPAGSSISYGATYTTTKKEWIGTLPIGYADGYSRAMQGMTGLLPDGRRVEVIGRIAMDQCMVRLPEALPVGTVVTLLGQVQDEKITLNDMATQAGTIPYEMATSMAQRLPRQLVD